jgi:electron transfer flavoprotein alpha subunit
LGLGRRLSDETAHELNVLLIGPETAAAAQAAIAYGANQVFMASGENFKNYHPHLWLAVLEQLVEQIGPSAILMSHSDIGMDLAPRIAFRLKTVAIMDSLDMQNSPDGKGFRIVKPIYGGNLTAVYSSSRCPIVATLREKALPPATARKNRTGRMVALGPDLSEIPIHIRFVERVKEELKGPKLEDANVVVCGGRGLNKQDDLDDLRELADLLGGAVAGTRPLCEKGWVDRHQQVGLTGCKIAPKLYIAIGVSGAVQHMAGIVGAHTVVAINKDPDAAIFQSAHLGAVGDFKEVMPSFMDAVRELKVK